MTSIYSKDRIHPDNIMHSMMLVSLIISIWFFQGVGFIVNFIPAVRKQTAPLIILSTWAGLLISALISINLYFLVSSIAVKAFAWPLTISLIAVSLALLSKRWRDIEFRLNYQDCLMLAISVAGVAILLRPLLHLGGLGFYFSNNGEFSNYAAFSDEVQYHPVVDPIGMTVQVSQAAWLFVGLHSREAISGVITAIISTLSGKAALWTIQPVAAAFAFLTFTSFGLLILAVSRVYRAARINIAASWIIFAWFTLSCARQQFWTMSFVSQYLSIALLLGTAAFIFTADSCRRTKVVVVGLAVGAQALVYPEMFFLNAAMLLTLSHSPKSMSKSDIIASIQDALCSTLLGALVANKTALDFLIARGSPIPSGWDIFGPTNPLLTFFGDVVGESNIFSGPAHPNLICASAAIVLVSVGVAVSLWRSQHLKFPIALLIAAGGAVLFTIHVRAIGTNYMLAKLIFQFDWIIYLAIATSAISMASRYITGALSLLVLIVITNVAIQGSRFSSYVISDSRTSTFSERDGTSIRALYKGQRFYIPKNYLAIAAGFMVYGHDLTSVEGAWPDGSGITYSPDEPALLLGTISHITDMPMALGRYSESEQYRNATVFDVARLQK